MFLLLEEGKTGHRLDYTKALCEVIREMNQTYDIEFFSEDETYKAFLNYKKNRIYKNLILMKYLKKINKLIKSKKPDIIHFTSYDLFAPIGLFYLRKYKRISKIIITQHHLPKSKIKFLLLKNTLKHIEKIVIHTQRNENRLIQYGVRKEKIHKINYPVFNQDFKTKEMARSELNLPQEEIILLSAGGTRFVKGLDILLNALKLIAEQPFKLIIAGTEDYFKKDYIIDNIKPYRNKVYLDLTFLDKKKYNLYLDACDCVLLPYRKSFNGASGPLVEGIWRRKTIIGPNHNPFNKIINENKLGSTFTSENSESLATAIKDYVNKPQNEWNETAENYRKRLDVKVFRQNYRKIYKSLLNNN